MYGILVDTTKCTACERCVGACLEKNGLDPVKADNERVRAEDGLSAYRWSSIVAVDEGRFARKSCMHCVEPSCVSACLVGGITKSPDGPVIYDPDKCIGCRYCMLACPFHIPRYEWGETLPFMRKCDMCFDRLQQGRQPACVEACPNGALTFGERDELLHVAQDWLEQKPSEYFGHIWGESEFGGTSVLYVSDVDLAPLGWPETKAASIPSLTQPLIEKTPFIGLGVATCLLGINWIVQRRMRLAEERKTDRDADANLANKAGLDD